MRMDMIRPIVCAVTAIVVFSTANSASAMVPPYTICSFKGITESAAPGLPTISCWLTVTAKVDCVGNFEIIAAGGVPGSAACPGLFRGNFPWTGVTPTLGTVQTGASGSVAFNTGGGTLSMIAGGTVYNVSAPSYSSEVCDAFGNTVQVPDSVVVTGPNNFGNGPNGDPSNVSFETLRPDHLLNRGCNLVL